MGECLERHEALAVGWLYATYCVKCSAWRYRWIITGSTPGTREQAAGSVPDDEYQDRNQERLVRRFLGTVRSVEEDAHGDQLVLGLDFD